MLFFSRSETIRSEDPAPWHWFQSLACTCPGVWVKSADYWDVMFAVQRKGRDAPDGKASKRSLPQRVVRKVVRGAIMANWSPCDQAGSAKPRQCYRSVLKLSSAGVWRRACQPLMQRLGNAPSAATRRRSAHGRALVLPSGSQVACPGDTATGHIVERNNVCILVAGRTSGCSDSDRWLKAGRQTPLVSRNVVISASCGSERRTDHAWL